MIKLIVAVDRANAIGWTDGRLPWKLSGDMARFKQLTTGSTVLMGFNTFMSLNRPNGLPNRKNIVLTRKPYSEIRDQIGPDVDILSTLGLITSMKARGAFDDKDLWIIGGAMVYDEVLATGLADEIYLTLVDANTGADVALQTDLAAWKLFILREQPTRQWNVVQCEAGTTKPGEFPHTFITLTKQPHEHLLP